MNTQISNKEISGVAEKTILTVAHKKTTQAILWTGSNLIEIYAFGGHDVNIDGLYVDVRGAFSLLTACIGDYIVRDEYGYLRVVRKDEFYPNYYDEEDLDEIKMLKEAAYIAREKKILEEREIVERNSLGKDSERDSLGEEYEKSLDKEFGWEEKLEKEFFNEEEEEESVINIILGIVLFLACIVLPFLIVYFY